MKRLLRGTGWAVTMISLLLCAATLALWGWSYHREDHVSAGYWGYRPHRGYPMYFDAWGVEGFNTRGRWMLLGTLRGCVAGPGRHETRPHEKGMTLEVTVVDPAELNSVEGGLSSGGQTWSWLGLKYGSKRNTWAVAVPHYWAAGILAVLPALGVIRLRRRRRDQQAGLCLKCGYDLRATPLRCPECGTTPVPG
jgi:hypothetical protein